MEFALSTKKILQPRYPKIHPCLLSSLEWAVSNLLGFSLRLQSGDRSCGTSYEAIKAMPPRPPPPALSFLARIMRPCVFKFTTLLDGSWITETFVFGLPYGTMYLFANQGIICICCACVFLFIFPSFCLSGACRGFPNMRVTLFFFRAQFFLSARPKFLSARHKFQLFGVEPRIMCGAR